MGMLSSDLQNQAELRPIASKQQSNIQQATQQKEGPQAASKKTDRRGDDCPPGDDLGKTPLNVTPIIPNLTPRSNPNESPHRGKAKNVGGSQDFLTCLSNCIQAIDPLNLAEKTLLALLGGTFPKVWVNLPRIGTPITTILSYMSLGSGTAASGTNVARIIGRIASPVFVGYGLGMAGIEIACTVACINNPDGFPSKK
jgi:hypothetical protein